MEELDQTRADRRLELATELAQPPPFTNYCRTASGEHRRRLFADNILTKKMGEDPAATLPRRQPALSSYRALTLLTASSHLYPAE